MGQRIIALKAGGVSDHLRAVVHDGERGFGPWNGQKLIGDVALGHQVDQTGAALNDVARHQILLPGGAQWDIAHRITHCIIAFLKPGQGILDGLGEWGRWFRWLRCRFLDCGHDRRGWRFGWRGRHGWRRFLFRWPYSGQQDHAAGDDQQKHHDDSRLCRGNGASLLSRDIKLLGYHRLSRLLKIQLFR